MIINNACYASMTIQNTVNVALLLMIKTQKHDSYSISVNKAGCYAAFFHLFLLYSR